MADPMLTDNDSSDRQIRVGHPGYKISLWPRIQLLTEVDCAKQQKNTIWELDTTFSQSPAWPRNL